MNVSNSKQSKGRHEGCTGKWLTTKSKPNDRSSHGKQNIKQKKLVVCSTRILKPLHFEPPPRESKMCKMKQSTMSQFFVEKSRKLRKLKKHKRNSDEKLSTCNDTVSVVLPMKIAISCSSALSEYEELWGSDEDETVDDVQKAKSQELLQDSLSTVDCKATHNIDSSEQRSDVCTQEDAEKLFPSPKRLKTTTDSMGVEIRAINHTRSGDVRFTQWLENEVDAFIEHNNEDKKVINKEHLLSMSCRYPSSCKPSDSDQDPNTLIPQFSEWFNHQIQKMNHKELPAVNLGLQQSPSHVSRTQHNSTFTQWFEKNLENCKTQS